MKKDKLITPFRVQPLPAIYPFSAGRPTQVEINIKQRAYQLYSSRGGDGGHELEDWLQAEREIMHAEVAHWNSNQ